MTSSGVATGVSVDPGCPSCPPGLPAPRLRSDLGAGLANPSELGGLEELREVCPTPRLQLRDPHPHLGKLRLQRLDQPIALRELLKQLLNRPRPGHREIINTTGITIKPPRRSTGPDLQQRRSTTQGLKYLTSYKLT